MAEGVCSQKRAKVVVVALLVVCIVSACIAVIVYFSTKDGDNDQTGNPESNKQEPVFRLPNTVVPVHYDLQLTPDIYRPSPTLFTLQGALVVRVRCQEVTSEVVMHALGLQVSRDGMRVTSETGVAPAVVIEVISWTMDEVKEALTLNLDTALQKGQTYDIHLTFTAPLTQRFQAAYYSTYQENGQTKYLAATIFVPAYARMAFPCWDEPGFKAEYTLTVLRKNDYIALSNMPKNTSAVRMVDGEEWIADTFQKSPPMSTYLLTFTVCQFESQEANTTRGYKFKAWSRPQSIQQTTFALEVGTKVMPFFDDYFGIPFPLPEQEMIALPEYQYGGMEHWGLVGYKETTLLYSDKLPSSEDRQRIATIIAHELGHMWFGDLLTMQWWDDTWLNEGFATYVQYLGIDHAYPQWNMREQFITETLRTAMHIDSYLQSRPLYKPVLYPDDVLAAYDRIIYFKGASIIRMAKFFLGESTFKRGIQNYVAEFQYGSATHNGLWNALNKEAEVDGIMVNVSDVMQAWTVQSNYPVVTVTRHGQGHMTLTQERFPFMGQPGIEKYRWDIPFTFTTSSTIQPGTDPMPNDVIWLSRHQDHTNVTHSSIPNPGDESQWLLGNLGCYGFYRVNYDESNWRALIKQLRTDHQRIGVANRAQIIMDSWSLSKTGALNYTLSLETLGYLQNETSYLPWHAALMELQDLKHVLKSNLTVYQLFSTFMQKQTSKIFQQFDPSVVLLEELDRRTPMIVAQAACQYDLPACVDLAKQQFAQWRHHPDNNTLHVDMRPTFYCSALAHGNRSDWDFVFAQYLDTSLAANERARLRLALACSRDPDTLKTLINRTLDQAYIRGQDAIDTLITCSNNIHGRDLVWAFVRDNFEIIDQRFGQTAFNLKELFSGITKSFYTEQELQQLQELSERYPHAASAMSDSVEQVRGVIHWVQTKMPVLEQWLRSQIS